MASRSSAGESASKHVWKFVRTGGLDQVRFETAADFLDLGNLDQKLWVALSGPTRGLHFDERTLALVDADGDGRIRAPELIVAVQRACQHLKDLGVLAQGSAALPLSATRPMPSFIDCHPVGINPGDFERRHFDDRLPAGPFGHLQMSQSESAVDQLQDAVFRIEIELVAPVYGEGAGRNIRPECRRLVGRVFRQVDVHDAELAGRPKRRGRQRPLPSEPLPRLRHRLE